MIDWNDDTPITLRRACEIAFPGGAVKPTSLKLRARQGKLRVYRPGKSYLTTLRDIRAMLDAVRVKPTQSRSGEVVYPAGYDEVAISRMALERALEGVEIGGRVVDPSRIALDVARERIRKMPRKR